MFTGVHVGSFQNFSLIVKVRQLTYLDRPPFGQWIALKLTLFAQLDPVCVCMYQINVLVKVLSQILKSNEDLRKTRGGWIEERRSDSANKWLLNVRALPKIGDTLLALDPWILSFLLPPRLARACDVLSKLLEFTLSQVTSPNISLIVLAKRTEVLV